MARQRERKEQELARQREEEIQLQRRMRSEEIAEQAREAFAQNDFVKAKELFEEAATYGFDTYKAKIDECQMKIDETNKRKAGISEFLETVKLASIPAFANNLKKRNNAVRITQDDIPFIIMKIRKDWSFLKSNDKKVWLDRKKWSPVEKELGLDFTNTIFDGINDLSI